MVRVGHPHRHRREHACAACSPGSRRRFAARGWPPPARCTPTRTSRSSAGTCRSASASSRPCSPARWCGASRSATCSAPSGAAPTRSSESRWRCCCPWARSRSSTRSTTWSTSTSRKVERWDVSAFFDRPFSAILADEIAHWDGVHASADGASPCPRRSRPRRRRHDGAITGISAGATFHAIDIVEGSTRDRGRPRRIARPARDPRREARREARRHRAHQDAVPRRVDERARRRDQPRGPRHADVHRNRARARADRDSHPRHATGCTSTSTARKRRRDPAAGSSTCPARCRCSS